MKNFPIIKNIDEIRPVIAGRDEFREWIKDGYIVVDYVYNDRKTFENELLEECRGLMFNAKTGELVSRGYHKFFNLGERSDPIDWSKPYKILMKMDGSMVRAVPRVDGQLGFRLATRAGLTDVAAQAEAYLAGKASFVDELLWNGITPIFEWCSRKNRVVVDYPEDRLILTGARFNDTGKYLSYEALVDTAEAIGPCVEVVQTIDVAKASPEQVKAWQGEEGIVVRFDDGHMVKIKSDWYSLLHKTRSQIASEASLIELCIENRVDDLLPMLQKVISLKGYSA